MSRTIYGYIRVSSTGQAGEDKTSLDEQRRKITGTAMMLGDEPAQIFCDAGVSGSIKVSDRPEGSLLYETIRAGDVLIVAKLDRLFRSAADADTTIKHLTKQGIDLISLDMGAEPVGKSAISQLMINMIAVFAEFERSLINERTWSGKLAKKARGGHTAGSAPRGFDVDGNNLIPNHEFAAMHEAYSAYKKGATCNEYLQVARSYGLVSRTGKPIRSGQLLRSFKLWDTLPESLRTMA